MRCCLLVIALVACSKPKPEPAPVPRQVSVCPRVADHLVSLMSGATKHPPEATDPLRRVIGERCEQDRWSDNANQCLLALTSLSDGEKCQAMLTPAQVEAFQRDSEAATVELRGQFSEEPPPNQPAAPSQQQAPAAAPPQQQAPAAAPPQQQAPAAAAPQQQAPAATRPQQQAPATTRP